MSNIKDLLSKMWADYISMTPQAQKIVDLLEGEGEEVINDHIALRTFNLPKVTIDVLAKPFLDGGYTLGGEYHFEEKKLFAKHYSHPDPNLPKVFISELLIENFSEDFQNLVKSKVDQLSESDISAFDFLTSGRNWDISSDEFQSLKSESEYGAWLSAIGFRPNHFTVYINKLKKYGDILELNSFLKESGFELNSSGGEVKGSKDVYLEQSSTLADNIEVEFSDKKQVIPSCYFEFAKRYEMDNGELFQGFVAKSADKIFESTDKGQA